LESWLPVSTQEKEKRFEIPGTTLPSWTTDRSRVCARPGPREGKVHTTRFPCTEAAGVEAL
jgi:hypothetical protein